MKPLEQLLIVAAFVLIVAWALVPFLILGVQRRLDTLIALQRQVAQKTAPPPLDPELIAANQAAAYNAPAPGSPFSRPVNKTTP